MRYGCGPTQGTEATFSKCDETRFQGNLQTHTSLLSSVFLNTQNGQLGEVLVEQMALERWKIWRSYSDAVHVMVADVSNDRSDNPETQLNISNVLNHLNHPIISPSIRLPPPPNPSKEYPHPSHKDKNFVLKLYIPRISHQCVPLLNKPKKQYRKHVNSTDPTPTCFGKNTPSLGSTLCQG